MTASRRIVFVLGALLALTLVLPAPASAGDDQSSRKSAWWSWTAGVANLYAQARPAKPVKEDASNLSANPRSEKGAAARPTSIPILDPDFLPEFSWDPRDIDPETWMQVGGPEAHQYATGRGVVVAVLDVGINPRHPSLRGHVHRYSYDAVDRDMDPTDLGNGFNDDGGGEIDECVGHGTFVAGMVLLAAPDAEILFIRVGDDEGHIDDRALIRGLKWARWMGADVINLSLRVSRDEHEAANALIHEAEAEGIVVVTAAGNNDQRPVPYVEGSLLVGAVDRQDFEAGFTSFSRGQDGAANFLYAPGVDLHGPLGSPRDNSVAWWSGTSFATAIVSGAAALLQEVHPEMDLLQRMERLANATAPVIRQTGQFHKRAGRIDLVQVIR